MEKTLLGSPFLYALLYVSIGISLAGIIFRITRWFVVDTGPEAGLIPVKKRAASVLKGMASFVFSLKILKMFKVLIFEVLLQSRILKKDFIRWIMHFCIFFGFTMLLLMHALDKIITKNVFTDYFPTIDPFQFLRNLFGLMVIFGVGIAVYRRIRSRGSFLATRYADRYALVILAVIIVSGFLEEGVKMISENAFNRMVNTYLYPGDPEDVDALKAFSSKQYGTVFSSEKFNTSPKLLAKGEMLNKQACASCHAPAKTAFISYPASRLIKPFAVTLNKTRADIWLYYLHVLACFIGLAYLPFSKFFHLIADPLTIAVNGVSDPRNVDPSTALTRRAMELDACTECGTCSRYCSVSPVFTMLHNTEILPMHKILTLKRLSSGKKIGNAQMMTISEGAFICTTCFKCTEVCPAGINLQDQWLSSRELLSEMGHPLPHVWLKKFNASEWSDRMRENESTQNEADEGIVRYNNLTGDSNVFALCIQCQTCTNVCSVVAARTDPRDAVDITPHKIMNLLRLGLHDLTLGSRMVWDCVTCYQCQENCPQGIRVTDIIYELKNKAYAHFKKIDRSAAVKEDPC
jgi:heterodisulfide reductase subunit C/nitrate reductase gamma subunit